ncbi:general stress protein [Paenisporosarcina sp. TG20]|uniref:general stress protein n=1 Tax=Paenisporosarcina sp. TG20 TaxID=1211706 RepID=UPI0003032EE2|nr:general stress protein [Paenisporosarcina sp. TG20]
MNTESNSNRHIEVARTEDEMYNRLEVLKSRGYEETDIHVISKDHSQINTLSRYSNVATHEAGTLTDKFKSWFTGEDAVTEGLRPLNLTEAEKEKYSGEVARGSFVLYTDYAPDGNIEVFNEEEYDTFGATGNSYESYSGDNRPLDTTGAGIDNRVHTKDPQMTATAGTDFVESRFTESETTNGANETTTFGSEEPSNVNKHESKQDEPESEYAKEQGFEKSTNEFVNETDGRYDEPVDRFARGESFSTDPVLARDTDHIGTSMQEKQTVQEHRPTNNERNQNEENIDMDPDRDTNRDVTSKLNDIEAKNNRITTNEPITDAYKTEGFQSPGVNPNLGPAVFGDEEESKFTTEKNVKHDFDKDPRNTELNYRSNDKEHQRKLDTNSLNEDEDITTDQYKERMDKDK